MMRKPKTESLSILADDASRSAYKIPTVRFNPDHVTDVIKADLRINVEGISDFNNMHVEQVYEAAVRSIARGGDLATLFQTIIGLDLPEMTKQRAGEIALTLNRKAAALIKKERQLALGIKYAIWTYSGAPCWMNKRKPTSKEVRQDAAHKAANGKQYEVARGMLLNGKWTMPGRDEGCKCGSRSILPGDEPSGN